jgi:hypothetical protein
MGTSQFGRGHKPCTGTESQSTEWQKGSLPERTQRKGNATAALECRSGNGGRHMSRKRSKGLMCWRARSTPTPPGRNFFRCRVRGQGCLPGRRNVRAQMIAQAAISEGSQRKRIRQLLRGAQHAPQPGMVRYHSSTGCSTEAKESTGVRLPPCSPKAFRVTEMSEVTRTFTGQHLTHRQNTSGEIQAWERCKHVVRHRRDTST